MNCIVTFAFGVAFLPGIPLLGHAAEADSCSVDKPPKAAAVSANHGSYYFIYPGSVPESYTGCQTMWDEHAQKIFRLRFLDGALTEFLMIRAEDQPLVSCAYDQGKPVPGNVANCPVYNDVKNGLKIEHEPPVPADRDARAKS